MAKTKQSWIRERVIPVEILEDLLVPESGRGGEQPWRVSHARWQPGFRFVEPMFTSLFVGLVLHGHGEQGKPDGSVEMVQPGDLLIAGGGGCRVHLVPGSEPLEVLFAVFQAGVALDRARDQFPDWPLVKRLSRPGSIEQLMRVILREGRMARLQPGMVCQHLGSALLTVVAEHLHETGRSISRREQVFQRARRHVWDHLDQRLTVALLATRLAVTPTYLTRLFHEFEGVSTLRYIQSCQMAAAAERLQNRGESVQEVAAAMGFEDPFVFSRTFKRVRGNAPSETGKA